MDATVLEVGVGGTYDSTNIVPQPITTGVTALGIDHIWVLGKTLPEIAHQKGGIYKVGQWLFSHSRMNADCDLDADSLEYPPLRSSKTRDSTCWKRAQKSSRHPRSRSCLNTHSSKTSSSVRRVDRLSLGVRSITDTNQSPAGLAGIHQRSNASLAVALVRSFLASARCPPAFSAASSATNKNNSVTSDPSSSPADKDSLPALPTDLVAPNPLPEPYIAALEQTRWPGRCQLSPDPKDGRIKWYLDGAHTVESLKCCGEWFAEEALARCARFLVMCACESLVDVKLTSNSRAPHSQESAERVLIFNCTSGRSGLSLLGALTSSLSPPNASKPTTTNNKQQPFKHVIFCTNTTFASGSSKGGEHARSREILLKQHSKTSCLARLIPPPRVIPRRSRPPPSPPQRSTPVPCEDLTSNAVDAKDLETLATQRELAAAWEELAATLDSGATLKANVHILGSIEEAIDVVRHEAAQESGKEVQALVTGSLHLVGGVMAVADLPL